MARQHGYFILIPAFIPVDKNNLANQVAAGQVLSDAASTRDLAAIMALPGIRYHAMRDRAGVVKDMHVRWGSREVDVTTVDVEEPAETAEQYVVLEDEAAEGVYEPAEAREAVEQDEATTTGRRRRTAA